MKTYLLKAGVRQAIAKAGETDIAVAYNAKTWMDEYPAGNPQLMVTTPGGKRVPVTVEAVDNLITGQVPNELLAGPGVYSYVFVWTSGSTQLESGRCECLVLGSGLAKDLVHDSRRTPEWAERIFLAAEVIEGSIDGAIEARNTAADMAAEAAESEANAAGSAEDAEDSATLADQRATAAQESAEDAAASAAAMHPENYVAQAFSASSAYRAGTYVMHEGYLYRLTADHDADVTWENTEKVQVKVADDVGDLKSALENKANSDFSNVADNAISSSLINGVLSYSRLTEFDDYTVANNNRIYGGTNAFKDTTEIGISNTGIIDLSALSGIDTINVKFSTTEAYQVFVIQKSNDSVAGYYRDNLPSSFATNKGNYYEINLTYLRSVNTVKFAVNFDTGTEEVITYAETVSQEAKSLEWLRLSANNGHVPIIVDANGNGDYTTIQAAVDAASDYDEILVMPGTYEEAVTVSNKYIYIRGLDANTTILVNHSGAYATCPLQMCTGVLENMTIYHQKTGEVSVNRYGYAIHLDQVWGTRMQLRNFTIRNCIVISDFATTIGCGVVDGCRVIIDGCKIIHTGVLNDRQAAFQVHGDSANDGSAFFVIRNSILDVPTTSTANAILFTNGGSNTGTTFDLLALNNVITKMYNNVGDLLTINPLSCGNNISELNLAPSPEVLTARKANNHEVNRKILNAKHATSPLSILYFSDLHGDEAALKRIMDDASTFTGIDDAICTGDIVSNNYESIASWWNPSVMTCIGNHDTASYSGGTYNWTALSMADRDSYYIAPFEANWGITHTSGTSYYYKDYATQKVRLIVMDVMLYNDNGAEATAQTSWLENLLADAITNNLHVLIAIHTAHGGATAKECSFSRYNQDVMPTYSDCNTPQIVIDAVATKITAGLKFVGYICGHAHQDNIWDAENDGKQLMYCVTCANTSNSAQWADSDQYRDADNDAYNIIVIDTTNTLVKLVRGGGADIDDHMRTRKAICFNYSTGEKVGEVL